MQKSKYGIQNLDCFILISLYRYFDTTLLEVHYLYLIENRGDALYLATCEPAYLETLFSKAGSIHTPRPLDHEKHTI